MPEFKSWGHRIELLPQPEKDRGLLCASYSSCKSDKVEFETHLYQDGHCGCIHHKRVVCRAHAEKFAKKYGVAMPEDAISR